MLDTPLAAHRPLYASNTCRVCGKRVEQIERITARSGAHWTGGDERGVWENHDSDRVNSKLRSGKFSRQTHRARLAGFQCETGVSFCKAAGGRRAPAN
jgi:hypothetical protein